MLYAPLPLSPPPHLTPVTLSLLPPQLHHATPSPPPSHPITHSSSSYNPSLPPLCRTQRSDYLNSFEFLDKLAENLKAKMAAS